MQTFRGCLPAVSFTIRGYMNANLAGKRRADTSRTFRQLLETLNVRGEPRPVLDFRTDDD
jgi:hypothetical protein